MGFAASKEQAAYEGTLDIPYRNHEGRERMSPLSVMSLPPRAYDINIRWVTDLAPPPGIVEQLKARLAGPRTVTWHEDQIVKDQPTLVLFSTEGFDIPGHECLRGLALAPGSVVLKIASGREMAADKRVWTVCIYSNLPTKIVSSVTYTQGMLNEEANKDVIRYVADQFLFAGELCPQ